MQRIVIKCHFHTRDWPAARGAGFGADVGAGSNL